MSSITSTITSICKGKNQGNKSFTVSTIPNICNKCSKSNASENIVFYIPNKKCHAYCFICFQTFDEKFDKIGCKSCKEYFKKIKKPVNKKECNLCRQNVKIFNKICNVHKYCDICIESLKEHNWTVYRCITDCENCIEGIMEWEKIHKESNMKPETFEPVQKKKCNLCKVNTETLNSVCINHEYCDGCMENFKLNNWSSDKSVRDCSECSKCIQIWVEIFERKKTSKILETLECNICLRSIKSFIQVCSEHIYCELCMKLLKENDWSNYKNIKECKNCSKDIEVYVQNFGRNDGNLTIKEEKMNNINQVIPIEEETNNMQLINSFSNYTSAEGMNGYQSIYIVTHCLKCNVQNSFISFLCSHNICKDCLSDSCYYEICNFFENFKADPDAIQIKFTYHCPFCGSPISLPTLMILKHKNLDISLYTPYIPYLDGILEYS